MTARKGEGKKTRLAKLDTIAFWVFKLSAYDACSVSIMLCYLEASEQP
ncbi:hypothetical protein COLO4_13765 [Corchorus olitorius]|uniref:Uncharacterized protein n=1 Tax=Corchorus olitorius TaxID=93759 RepID=A0A1R3JV55_9ROSI|nr:hypothetical protein COLO4_13765 [Corchorus olitorius]